VASAKGVRAGYQGALGVFVGDCVLLACVALGAASMLKSSFFLFQIIKYLGAAYLVWLGFNLLQSAVAKYKQYQNQHKNHHPNCYPNPNSYAQQAPHQQPTQAGLAVSDAPTHVPSTASIPMAHMQQPFRRALVISLLNPKAILFLLSFFVQFIDPDYAQPMVPFLILSVIVMAFSAMYLSVLIFAGARLAHLFSKRIRLSAGLSGSVGGLFIWFGAKLATASV
jgi:leucine efflux protein